jgi:hypothetical protein
MIASWPKRLNIWLTPRRMRYAWVAAGALWLTWLVSLPLGPGWLDLAGHPLGTDYLQFHTAGLTMRLGESARLYDFEYQRQLQQGVIGPQLQDFYAYLNPPHLAWLFAPLSALAYPASYVGWVLISLLLLWGAISLSAGEKSDKRKIFGWGLTFFPVIASITFGQNGLQSLAVLALTYFLWMRNRPLAAGLASSLLLFKPQLLIGLGLLWLLEGRQGWKALAGLVAGGVVTVVVSIGFMPKATADYLAMARSILPGITAWEGFPLWHSQTWRAFWLLLLPGQIQLSEILALALSVLGVAGFLIFKRQTRQKEILFCAAILLTLWVAPHAMIYDWAILLLPALILWQSAPELRSLWRASFAVLWTASFVAGPFVILQKLVLPVALQVSLPALWLAIIWARQPLAAHPGLDSSVAGIPQRDNEREQGE